MEKLSAAFTSFAKRAAKVSGHPLSFCAALLIIVVWASVGPMAGFSDTWQLVINTSTTIITFLMVFLIQNTQNRDTQAMQLKLDELIHAIKEADDGMVGLEEMDDEELKRAQERYSELAEKAKYHLETGRTTKERENGNSQSALGGFLHKLSHRDK